MTRTYYTCRAISRRGQSQLHQDHQDDRAVPSPGGQGFCTIVYNNWFYIYIILIPEPCQKEINVQRKRQGEGCTYFLFFLFLKLYFLTLGKRPSARIAVPTSWQGIVPSLSCTTEEKWIFSIYLFLVVSDSEVCRAPCQRDWKSPCRTRSSWEALPNPAVCHLHIHRAVQFFPIAWMITYGGAAFIGLGRNDKVLLLRG